MLAVLGHPKGGAREHRVGLLCAIGGEDRRAGGTDGVEHIRQKIDHADIHLRLFAGVMIAQKDAEFVDHRSDRAVFVAVGAVEGLAGINVGKP